MKINAKAFPFALALAARTSARSFPRFPLLRTNRVSLSVPRPSEHFFLWQTSINEGPQTTVTLSRGFWIGKLRSHGASRRAKASQSMVTVRHGRERRGMVSGLVRLRARRSSDRSDRPCFQCERTESRARRRLRQLRTVLPIGLAPSLFRVLASHRFRPRLPCGALVTGPQ